jgi:hypothetical protein
VAVDIERVVQIVNIDIADTSQERLDLGKALWRVVASAIADEGNHGETEAGESMIFSPYKTSAIRTGIASNA